VHCCIVCTAPGRYAWFARHFQPSRQSRCLPGFLAAAATIAAIIAARTAAAQEEQDQDNENEVPAAAIASTKHVWHLLSGSLHCYHMTAAGKGAGFCVPRACVIKKVLAFFGGMWYDLFEG